MSEYDERRERLYQLAMCPEGHDTRHYHAWLDEIASLKAQLAETQLSAANRAVDKFERIKAIRSEYKAHCWNSVVCCEEIDNVIADEAS